VGTILKKLLILRHSNQKKALEVFDGACRSAPSTDIIPLLIVRGMDNKAPSIASLGARFFPKAFADGGGDATDEDSRLRFEEPPCQFASQSGWNALKNQDHHLQAPNRQFQRAAIALLEHPLAKGPRESRGRRHPGQRGRRRPSGAWAASAPTECRG